MSGRSVTTICQSVSQPVRSDKLHNYYLRYTVVFSPVMLVTLNSVGLGRKKLKKFPRQQKLACRTLTGFCSLGLTTVMPLYGEPLIHTQSFLCVHALQLGYRIQGTDVCVIKWNRFMRFKKLSSVSAPPSRQEEN